jgi:hypothetical protein
MPESYPDYPRHDQILAYIRSFAQAYGLYEGIQFNTSVDAATLNDDTSWDVQLSNGETRRYAWLVCINGHTWDANSPEIPGQFDGQVMHAVDYRDPSQFAGKRVLVVGAGNSGCDIACDAAQSADAAYISMRRGYHFLPKHIFGKPMDLFFHSGPQLPMWIAQPVLKFLLKLVNGDITRYGLQKPEHSVLGTHPIVNSQLLHHLAHGDIAAKPAIARLDGQQVVFADDTRETVDLVLLATGYHYSIPFIDKALLDWSGYKPELSYYCFSPRQETLFCLGFVELNSGGYFLYDRMAQLIGNAILDRRAQSARVAQLADIRAEKMDFSGGIQFAKESERMINYADSDTYQKAMKTLVKRMGWQVPSEADYAPLGRHNAGERLPD